MWELPGGKVEDDEVDRQALRREIAEELDVEITVGRALGRDIHAYDDIVIELVCYRCEIAHGEPHAREHCELRWLDRQGLRSVEWAPADLPMIRRLEGPDGGLD